MTQKAPPGVKGLDTKPGCDHVYKSLCLKQKSPQYRNGNGSTQNRRDVISSSEKVHALDLKIQDISDKQSKDQFQWNGKKGIFKGLYKCLHDQWVAQYFFVVA